MIQKLKKITTLIIITFLLIGRVSIVSAFDIPSAPEPPKAPEVSELPSPPEVPSVPSIPSAPSEITTPKEDKQEEPQINPDDTKSSGNIGDTTIKTGNALTNGIINTEANNNSTSNNNSDSSTNNDSGNSNNGSLSQNSLSSKSSGSSTTSQENTAETNNKLDLSSSSGENIASKNVGNSFIETGDANTSGTGVTVVNTNTAGITVSEFNIADDQNGDLILDFSKNCISGCSGAPLIMENLGNGTNSQNTSSTNEVSNESTLQTNDALTESSLILSSDSGNNETSKNTGGDSIIKTGDANTSGNLLTFTNNNIAGKVIVGVVNIFGNLVGDIILPASDLENGTESSSSANINKESTSQTLQTNDADILNNLSLSSTSGDNTASKNTGGDSIIKTGNSTIQTQTLNIANSNIEEGNIWLVIVNKAGEWIGQILGAPEGSNFAGSTGTDFIIGPNGEITATNSGNGSESTNINNVSQKTDNKIDQENNATIVNNLNLSANTGNNEASNNTGGDSYIETGDAKVIANLINFVNNNISGKGKLIATVVNVFGSWVGDLVTPGSQKKTSENTVNNVLSNENNPVSSGSPISDIQSVNNNSDSNSPPSMSAISSISSSNNVSLNNQTLILGSKINSNDPPSKKNDLLNNKEAYESNSKLSINLAWLLLLAPFTPLLTILKKKS